MDNLEALMRESPPMTLSIRELDDGRVAAMIEAKSDPVVRIGWGAGKTVDDAVVDALKCMADDKAVA